MELKREEIIKALECCKVGEDCWACPYDNVGVYSQCEPKLLEDALSLINELAEENERVRGEWISVKDKLPDNYRAVLVVCQSTSISGGILRAVGSYGGGCWSMADADGTMRLTKYMQYTVTHWMELPQIPKGV